MSRHNRSGYGPYCRDFGVTTAVFINSLDREHADFFKTLDSLDSVLGARAVAVQIPLGQEEDFRGMVDLLAMKALVYEKDGSGTFAVQDIPDEVADEVEARREALIEAIVEADDALMEKYLDGGEIEPEEVTQALRRGVIDGIFTPVFCGSAVLNMGAKQLLDFIVDCFPLAR